MSKVGLLHMSCVSNTDAGMIYWGNYSLCSVKIAAEMLEKGNRTRHFKFENKGRFPAAESAIYGIGGDGGEIQNPKLQAISQKGEKINVF